MIRIWREEPYDRRRLLDRAARAARSRRRGRRRKAVALYRRVLAAEPDNPDLLRKIAPLLALTKESDDACESYRLAAERFVERGFPDRAVGIYRDAVRVLPHEASMWKGIAALEIQRGRKTDAVAALLEGRRGFRRRRHRAGAIELLWAARKIDPTHLELHLDLASLLGRSGASARAISLLDAILPAHPTRAARIRGQQFWIRPGLGAGWRWLLAALGR